MPKLSCPHCGKNVSIEADTAGNQRQCPHCAATLPVPTSGQETQSGPSTSATMNQETVPPTGEIPDQETVSPSPELYKDAVTIDSMAATSSHSVPPNGAFPTVPGYEILGELGRGGMGVVYKAKHLKLNRIVALKMILSGSHASSDDRARFVAEAEAVAAFQHPNIVQVFDSGQHHSLPYMSLEFVTGGNLADRINGQPLPPKVAAHLIEQLARGMHAAHEAGIVHRDLKPANVLLQNGEDERMKDEKQALANSSFILDLSSIVPKITDFGLAKRVESGRGLTATGAVMGTPSYIAPEQARGEGKRVGLAVDVYALGAILYECLTGHPPFLGSTPMDIIVQVMEREPAPPSLLNPKVDKGLESICLKCLEKDPHRRYPSAIALALDLRRYLNGESISISNFNLLARLARSLERSQYDVEFRGYGTMLLYFAAIVAGEHLVLFFLTLGGPPFPHGWVMLTRVLQFLLMGLVFWHYRKRQLLPTTTAERQLWAIVLSYLVSSFVAVGTFWCLASPDPRYGEMELFPTWSILAGVVFCMMGSSYWGRCYIFAAAFFAAALLMPLHMHSAPLVFGGLWTLVLTLIGLRLRRLGRDRSESLADQTTKSIPPWNSTADARRNDSPPE